MPAFSDDEQILVQKLIDNDEEAFCELYARYKSRLIYFAFKFLKSEPAAEDIFQDTFTVIWQSRKFLDPQKSFSSYVFTILKNRVLNELKKYVYEHNVKNHILEQAVDYHEGTMESVIKKDFETILQESLNLLPVRQRQVFEMSRKNNFTYREIGETLGISVYTVQEHISNAIQTMRRHLKKYAGDLTDIILLLLILNI